MPTKFRDLERMLREAGYKLERVTGSHHIYVHPEKGSVSVPFYGSNHEIAPGTLKAILRQAGLQP